MPDYRSHLASLRSLKANRNRVALFDLDRESLEAGVTKDPVENPGQRTVTIRYEHPIRIESRVC